MTAGISGCRLELLDVLLGDVLQPCLWQVAGARPKRTLLGLCNLKFQGRLLHLACVQGRDIVWKLPFTRYQLGFPLGWLYCSLRGRGGSSLTSRQKGPATCSSKSPRVHSDWSAFHSVPSVGQSLQRSLGYAN